MWPQRWVAVFAVTHPAGKVKVKVGFSVKVKFSVALLTYSLLTDVACRIWLR